MKHLLLLFLLLPVSVIAQTEIRSPSGSEIHKFVDRQPAFPGGDAKLLEYIKANLKYPAEAKKAGVNGLVIAEFVVDIDGTISEPEITKKLGHGLDEEAIRFVKSLPKFEPAQKDGKIVAFRYTLPLRFDKFASE